MVGGHPSTITGVLFDQGANDGPWTGTVNYGDRTPTEPCADIGAPPTLHRTRGPLHADAHAHAGNFNLTVTATDRTATTPAFPWTTMAPDPRECVPHVAQISRKLIHGFDADPFGNRAASFPAEHHVPSNTWTTGASPSLVRVCERRRDQRGSWPHRRRLRDVGLQQPHECAGNLRPATNQWSLGPAVPTVRFAAAVGVIGNKL